MQNAFSETRKESKKLTQLRIIPYPDWGNDSRKHCRVCVLKRK